MSIQRLKIYTDGGLNSLDVGESKIEVASWAFIIINEDKKIIASSANNSLNFTVANAELKAMDAALRQVSSIIKSDPTNEYKIDLYSDSAFAVNSLNKHIVNWKRNATKGTWIKSNGEAVVNQDEFNKIDKLVKSTGTKLHHVEAHGVDMYNNLVDQFCTIAFRSLRNYIEALPPNQVLDIVNTNLKSEMIFLNQDDLDYHVNMNIYNKTFTGNKLKVTVVPIGNEDIKTNLQYKFDIESSRLTFTIVNDIVNSILENHNKNLLHVQVVDCNKHPVLSMNLVPNNLRKVSYSLKQKNFLKSLKETA